MNYKGAKTFILQKMRNELVDTLYYHGIHHTLDVLAVTKELCALENISEEKTILLKTAALFHDSGFTVSNQDHEATGCELVRVILPDFEYSQAEIDAICAMIMATKIPQSPHNQLEQIICDADLDYLGRPDFYNIGNTLFEELKVTGILKTPQEWNRIQVRFLDAHQFFTKTNITRREPVKQLYLQELRELVATYDA